MLVSALDSRDRKIEGTSPTFRELTSGEMVTWIISTQWNKSQNYKERVQGQRAVLSDSD